jgi:hypothetical protein
VFRNGDPSRPFLFEGAWYIVLGAGKNASSARSAPPLATPGCALCDVEWIQGELRGWWRSRQKYRVRGSKARNPKLSKFQTLSRRPSNLLLLLQGLTRGRSRCVNHGRDWPAEFHCQNQPNDLSRSILLPADSIH